MTTSDLFSSVLKLTPQGQTYNKETAALVIFPGGGSREVSNPRLSEVDWPKYTQRIWVAGTRGDPAYSEKEVQELLKRGDTFPFELMFQGYANHTKHQMEWVVDALLQNAFIQTLFVSTSEYHLPRCVLTFVKSWKKMGDKRKLKLMVLPTSNPHLKDNSTSTSQTVNEELERIDRYQKKPYQDVATEREFKIFVERNC